MKIRTIFLIGLVIGASCVSLYLWNNTKHNTQPRTETVYKPPEITFTGNKEKFDVSSDVAKTEDEKELILTAEEFFAKHNQYKELNNAKVIKMRQVLKSELKKEFPNTSYLSSYSDDRVLYVNRYIAEDYSDSNLRAEEVMITDVYDAETETRITSSFKILKNGKVYGMPSQNE